MLDFPSQTPTRMLALEPGNMVCRPCHSSCLKCEMANDASSCTYCSQPGETHLYLQKQNDEATVGACQFQCLDNYFPTFSEGTGNICQLCGHNCSTCRNGDVFGCTSCIEGTQTVFQPSQESADTGACLEACSVGFAPQQAESGQQVCSPCHDSCASCTQPNLHSRCLACNPENAAAPKFQARGEEGYCVVDCDPTFQDFGDGICRQCSDTSFCLTCRELDNQEQCYSCNSSTPGHEFFQPSGPRAGGVGTCQDSCNPGFFKNMTDASHLVCSPCHSSCRTCRSTVSPDDCLSCPSLEGSEYVLQPLTSKELRGPCQKECSPRFAQLRVNLSADDSHLVCQPCHGSCLTCSLPADESSCSSCNSSAVAANLWEEASPGLGVGRCVSKCSDGYFLSTGTDLTTRLCTRCHADCSACEGGSSTQCRSCSDNSLSLQPSGQSQSVGKCVASCDPGYAQATTEQLAKVCLPCHTSCLTCSTPNSEGACLTCPSSGTQRLFLQKRGDQYLCVLSCDQDFFVFNQSVCA